MESTQPREQALFSLLQQGFDGSDKPPADVTAFAEAVFSWPAIDAELDRISFDSYEPGDGPR
jgi:hypothetical protein